MALRMAVDPSRLGRCVKPAADAAVLHARGRAAPDVPIPRPTARSDPSAAIRHTTSPIVQRKCSGEMSKAAALSLGAEALTAWTSLTHIGVEGLTVAGRLTAWCLGSL